MSGTTVSLLTAPGGAAIAVVEVRGPHAYLLAKRLFAPAGKPLPESPEVGRFWFGTLGRDEVVLSVTAADAVEVHCHGGPRVVRWVTDAFSANRDREGAGGRAEYAVRCAHPLPHGRGSPAEQLQRAPTLRTASILLDQLNGAFANEVRCILSLLEADPSSAAQPLVRLAQLGETVGRHLVEPWKVVIAGPPNVGKSSLVNALAGYQRAVVSEVAGTTRDAVGVRVAFDGWPVELIDTAGLRDAEGLEAEGIERARRVLGGADLIVWVMDGTAPEMVWASEDVPPSKLLSVVNKSDVMTGWGPDPSAPDAWGLPLVSAITGTGMGGLAAELVRRLVPDPPNSGEAVPFTARLIDLINAANAAPPAETARLLREALAAVE